MSTFIIVVDAQADFMLADGALSVPGAAEIIAPLDRWLAALRPADTAGVLFTFDTHDAATYAGSVEAAQFPPHCLEGMPGWRLVADAGAVDAAIPTFALRKGVFDMWAEESVAIAPFAGGVAMPREAFFADLRAHGVDEVVVVGVAADFCVRWAVEGLVERGFRVVVPAALTRGIVRDIVQVQRDEWFGAAVVLRGRADQGLRQ